VLRAPPTQCYETQQEFNLDAAEDSNIHSICFLFLTRMNLPSYIFSCVNWGLAREMALISACLVSRLDFKLRALSSGVAESPVFSSWIPLAGGDGRTRRLGLSENKTLCFVHLNDPASDVTATYDANHIGFLFDALAF
jgi:hypothetical protein